MKYTLLIILLIVLFSCKKDNKTKESELSTNSFFEKAKEYSKKNITDSAFYNFNLAKNSFLDNKDSIGAARALANMAQIQTSKGDFFGSIKTSLESNKFLKDEKDVIVTKTLTSNYNNMAIASNNLKVFDSAYIYYEKALRYVDNNEDKYICYNNIGDVLISKGNLKLAKEYLKKAILTDNSSNYSRAVNNYAKAKYLYDKNYNPLPEFFQALEIREKTNDEWGKNSSFETLSEYYLNRDKNLSLNFAKKMLQSAIKNKSIDDQIIALQKIIKLDPKNYLENFQRFDFISDSIQTARSRDKNQFAVVRYDLEAKNADNQKLKSKSFKQDIGISTLVIILIGGLFWYRKRKKRLQQENELKIKNNQLKLSKKVHDVVANGIYQVITKIENQENIDKNEMLDELEFVYEKSRDISYEKIDAQEKDEDFSKKISKLIATFKNETVNTYVAGNDETIWKEVKPSAQEEVYQIIRELLVNMKKHSQADRVVLKFERINNFITIHYTDNGVGISGELIYKNGLTSTVSRIENVRGEIIFDTEIEKGLKITISFPI
ncbi:tetratricopeptide repeat-containing sensor histidine kinase [Chryseobacterium sp. G0201]|uniref:tetratricopeptide repeat-containing sensor histidine kinase n=1 Tax=Chryseobacterium sp. G0201 TaxID=2487065 RepID=UPI000F50B9F9|nr:tetratricopeptide repeat-containing sensor histidine kinase [Chryseobacterium sp. G0201]AZA52627.1 tetratricopeptide repeat-containing sensor histidine kinase [Chryseobacterium sp. G0201]